MVGNRGRALETDLWLSQTLTPHLWEKSTRYRLSSCVVWWHGSGGGALSIMLVFENSLPRGFSRALLSFRSWCWHGPLFNFPKRFSAALDLKMIYTWHVPTGSWTLSQGARGLKQTSAVKVSETLVYMSPLFKQNQQLWCCYRSPGRVSDLVGSSLLDIRVGSLQKGHLHWMAQPEATL